MKRIGTVVMGLLLGAVLLLAGCGPKEPDISKKYVIFVDNYGNEYRVDFVTAEEYFVDYSEEKLDYSFQYDAFYDDNDAPTGESGRVEVYAVPGIHYVNANINLGYGPHERFSIKLCVQTEAKVTYNVRSAIEYGPGKFKYRYNPEEKCYPELDLYGYGHHELTLKKSETDHISKCINERGEECGVPKEIGVYQVTYSVGPLDYVSRDKGLIYYPIEITVEVEIIV